MSEVYLNAWNKWDGEWQKSLKQRGGNGEQGRQCHDKVFYIKQQMLSRFLSQNNTTHFNPV